jgi:hypothetical protein
MTNAERLRLPRYWLLIVSEDIVRKFVESIRQGANVPNISVVPNVTIFEHMDKQIKDALDQFPKILEKANQTVTETVISTNIGDLDSGIKYETTIRINGDIASKFPTSAPNENDIYWKTHMNEVNHVLQMRKDIILKVIDTVGSTVRGMVNPISFSTVDIARLVELFQSSSK